MSRNLFLLDRNSGMRYTLTKILIEVFNMKICPNCGSELMDTAVVCASCGCSLVPQQPQYQQPMNYGQPQYQQPAQPMYQQPMYQQPMYQQPMYQPIPMTEMESSGIATCALVFAFLFPIVGLILGIVGLNKYKNPSYRSSCTAAIIISIVVWIISAIISVAVNMALFY